MKNLLKFLITFYLITSASLSSAEWSPLFASTNYDVYIDKATIKKNGDKTRVWVMYDFYEKLDGTTKSMKDFNEFDCRNQQSRVLGRVAYPETMGTGKVIFSVLDKINSPPPFALIVPGSVADGISKIICVK